MPIIMSAEKKRYALHQAMLLHLSRLELQTSTHPFSPLLGLGCSPGLHSAKVWKTCENVRKHVNVSNEVQSGLRLQDFLWTFCEHFEFWAQICSSFWFLFWNPRFSISVWKIHFEFGSQCEAKTDPVLSHVLQGPRRWSGLWLGIAKPTRLLLLWALEGQTSLVDDVECSCRVAHAKIQNKLKRILETLSESHVCLELHQGLDFVMRHGWRILGWYFWNSRPHRQIPCAELHWRSFQEGHIAEGKCLQILNMWVQIKESHRIKWKDW